VLSMHCSCSAWAPSIFCGPPGVCNNGFVGYRGLYCGDRPVNTGHLRAVPAVGFGGNLCALLVNCRLLTYISIPLQLYQLKPRCRVAASALLDPSAGWFETNRDR
jgi:hypothetical protein